MASSGNTGPNFVPAVHASVPWETRQHIEMLYQKLNRMNTALGILTNKTNAAAAAASGTSGTSTKAASRSALASSGFVALSNPAAVSVSIGAEINDASGQSIPNATDTTLTLSTVVRDTAGLSGVTANALQVPAGGAGWYIITASAHWASAPGGTRYLWLKKNGSFTTGPVGSSNGSGGDVAQQASYVTYLSVGDYITLDALQNSGGAINVNSCTLSMALI